MLYPKINGLYKRSSKGKITGELVDDFEKLMGVKWLWSEKLDGTNVRLWWDYEADMIDWGGRSNNAQLPPGLIRHIRINAWRYKLLLKPGRVLFGEGVGAGIQKGGGNYSQDQRFVLFDIWDGEGWADRCQLEAIAAGGGVPCLPVAKNFGDMTIPQAEQVVRRGITSAFGDFQAEGLVGVTDVAGERVMIKIKYRDYY